jgi:cyanophycin synthetase
MKIERTVYVEERGAEYRGYWSAASRRIGGEFRELAENIWEVRRDDRRVRLCLSHVPLNNTVVSDLCADKPFAYGVAVAAGVPVPRHATFDLDGLERAEAFRRQIAGPCVVKPARDTSAGMGVTTMVEDRRRLVGAALLASHFCPTFLVEEMIAGESCRLLYVGGGLVHAVRRRGLRVRGDGRSAIGDLVARGFLDDHARWTLRTQRLSPGSVLAAGDEALVRSFPVGVAQTRELRTVYDEDITSLVGPGLRDEIDRVVAALECELAGVDVLTRDPSQPLAATGGALLEVNPAPGIHHHYVTDADREDHPATTRLLEYLLAR